MQILKNCSEIQTSVGVNMAVDGQKCQMMLMKDLTQGAQRTNQQLMENVLMLSCMQEGGSKRHFLKIANFSKTRRGLKPIRYATTVCNNGRPRNK